MPTRARFAALLVAFVAAGVNAGCETDEYMVLIAARSMGDIGVIEVAALHPGGGLVGRIGPSFIGRSMTSINGDEPIRIAVVLTHPESIVVHVRGCSGTSCAAGARVFVATRCYDVTGVVNDEVILYGPLSAAQDRDGDGFPSDPLATCVDPPVAAPRDCVHACSSPALDCNGCLPADTECQRMRMSDDPMSTPPGNAIHPGALDSCMNGIDEDCDGLDPMCLDADGDDYRECRPGEPGGMCDCNDTDPSIHPGADEPASECRLGIDRDCNGVPPTCDDDDDGFAPCATISTGSCDCDDADANINPDVPEICEPLDQAPKDNDCDGLFDELPTCRPDDLDGDGVNGCAPGVTTGCDCNDCDSGIHGAAPGVDAAREICGNTLDEDCDGIVGVCAGSDLDSDGQSAATGGGTDCDDADQTRYFGAPEICGNGISESCTGDAACASGTDADADRYLAGVDADCNDMRADVYPFALELCNGVDDDCDGAQDEVLSTSAEMGRFPQGDVGCTVPLRDRRTMSLYPADCVGGGCALNFHTSVLHCGGCGIECNVDGVNAADTCSDGRCVCAGQSGGTEACAGGPSSTCCIDGGGGGGCRDLLTEVNNCGRCNNECGGTSTTRPLADRCTAGMCKCGTDGQLTAEDISDPVNPRACCGGRVVPVFTDSMNCGQCGAICGPNSTCAGGMCRCSAPFDDCDGSIVGDVTTPSNGCETNLQNDLSHCGMCGRGCSRANATAECAGGACRINTCNSGYADCNGIDADGCETPLNTLTDCGSCRTPCSRASASATCATGSCRIDRCISGFDNCDGGDANGCETPLNTLMNCAACGVPCSRGSASASCATGACRILSCSAGFDNCDGSDSNGCETPLNTLTDCGVCRRPCDFPHATESCTTGSCVQGSCDVGWGDCGSGAGCETSLTTTMNCNGCGMMCSRPMATATCATMSCAIMTCNPGFGNCDAMDPNGCEQTLTTVMHCGACGIPCVQPNATPTCSTGTCAIMSCNSGFGDCSAGGGCETGITTTTNCGGCAPTATCGTGESCASGRCTCGATMGGVGLGRACGASERCCGGACINTSTDPLNCGACGTMCGPSEICSAGRCRCGAAGPMGAVGAEACTGTTPTCCAASMVCVDTNTSTSHCGACGVPCGVNETCGGGRCNCYGSMGSVGGGEACGGTPECCVAMMMCRPPGC